MDKREIDTINVLLAALIIVFLLSGSYYLLGLALMLIVNNLVFVSFNKLVAHYWNLFAITLGKINTRVMLTGIFIFFNLPLGLLFRIFNKEVKNYFKKDNKKTYFEKNTKDYNQEYFLHQW